MGRSPRLLMTLLSDLSLLGLSPEPRLITLAAAGLALLALYLLVRPLVQAAVAAALADGAEGEVRRMLQAPGRHWRSYYGLAAIGLVLNLLLFAVPMLVGGGQVQRAAPLLFLAAPLFVVLRLQSDYARAAALETRGGWPAVPAVVIGQVAVLAQVWAEVTLQGVALRAWGSDPS